MFRKYLNSFLQGIKAIFCAMQPKGRAEWIVLALSFCLYFPLALFLQINTTLIVNPTLSSDIYFDFDSGTYMGHVVNFLPILGGIRHPLGTVVAFPITIICQIGQFLFGGESMYFIALFFACCMISFANIYVYRYLKEIVSISQRRTILLTIFFAFCATNIVLSFTSESFLFSYFFLSFMILYFSFFVKKEENIPFAQVFLLSGIIGGITITNIIKCFIPEFFSNQTIRNIIKRAFIVLCFLFITILIIVLIRPEFIRKFFYFIQYTKAETYNFEYQTSIINALFSYFWSSPMVFGDFLNTPLHADADWIQLNIAPYNRISQYIFGLVILLLCVYSAYINRKNKLVYILLLSFLVDFLIVVIVKYGLYNSFIFGGHWVFIIPMLLAWIYNVKNETLKKGFDIILTCMLLFLIINNTLKVSEIINFALTYYPK